MAAAATCPLSTATGLTEATAERTEGHHPRQRSTRRHEAIGVADEVTAADDLPVIVYGERIAVRRQRVPMFTIPPAAVHENARMIRPGA